MAGSGLWEQCSLNWWTTCLTTTTPSNSLLKGYTTFMLALNIHHQAKIIKWWLRISMFYWYCWDYLKIAMPVWCRACLSILDSSMWTTLASFSYQLVDCLSIWQTQANTAYRKLVLACNNWWCCGTKMKSDSFQVFAKKGFYQYTEHQWPKKTMSVKE